jgi:hypothetical protein
MKILVTAKNSALFEDIYLHFSQKNEVFFTSNSTREDILSNPQFLSWSNIKSVNFDYIFCIDSPNHEALSQNFYLNLKLLFKNSLKIYQYLNFNKITKVILLSSISVYFRKEVVSDADSFNILNTRYGFLKILQESIISFGKNKNRVSIIRSPAILNQLSCHHFPRRLVENFLMNKTVTVYSPKSFWNACINIQDLLSCMDYLIEKEGYFGIYLIHAQNPMRIIDVVNQIKQLTNSSSKVLISDKRINIRNPRLIISKNLIPALTVQDSIDRYVCLVKNYSS